MPHMRTLFVAGVEPGFHIGDMKAGYRTSLSQYFHKPPKGLSLTAKHSTNIYLL